MSRYIIKFFVVIIFTVGFSQENPSETDTLKIKEKYGIRFGIDLSKQVRMPLVFHPSNQNNNFPQKLELGCQHPLLEQFFYQCIY